MKKVLISLCFILLASKAFCQVSTSTFLTGDQILNRVLNKPTADSLRVTGLSVTVTPSTSTSNVVLTNGVTIQQMPNVTLNPGSTVYAIQSDGWNVNVGSNVVITESRFQNETSTGTSGIITGVTSFNYTTAHKVMSWSFLVKDDTPRRFTTITPSIWGTPIYLENNDSDSEVVDIPQIVTFSVSLPISATVQYTIRKLNP